MINFLKDENCKSTKICKFYKNPSTILKTVDTCVFNATISNSVILSTTAFRLLVITISKEIACGSNFN